MSRTLLQINLSANTGSTGKIAEQIGRKAQQKGWDSIIAYGRGATSSSSQLIRIGSKIDILNHALQTRLLDNNGLASVKSTKLFLRSLDDIRIDIAHLHNIHGYYINYKLLFSYLHKRRIPIVWTLHDCWPFTGHCTYFDSVNCDKWRTQCRNCPGLSIYPNSLFLDRSQQNYNTKKDVFCSVLDELTLIPVSKWLERFVRDSFLKCANRIETIHNGIDISVFCPQIKSSICKKYNIPEKKNVVLGVASPWTKRKGFNDFLQLRGKLDDNYIVVLVGLSKEQIRQLPEGIVGISRTENQNELAQLYSCATVFVNPTYEDNYPTTNLEALACGTPVITYDTGGSPESVTADTGLVAAKGSINELYDGVVKLTRDDNEIRRKMCRQWAEQNCDSLMVYDKYIQLYESLLK